MLLHGSPALALGHRGHAFSFHFGSLANPAGIAVDNATGDVYVTEAKSKRVDEFEPVVTGGELTGEVEGASWESASIPSPGAIAVDNSTESTDPSRGDIYVVGNEKAIYKLDPEGKLLATIKAPGGEVAAKKFASVAGVAVDAQGDLYVYEAGRVIYRFNNALVNESISEKAVPLAVNSRPGFALDANGDFYLGTKGDAGPLQEGLLQETELQFNNEVAAAGEGTEFVVIAKADGMTDTIAIPALDYDLSTAVAVDPAEGNDVYVVNQSGFNSEKVSWVSVFGPEEGEAGSGTPIEQFAAPGLRVGDAVAVDAATGTVYVTDAASNSGDVDVFELEKAGAPEVADTAAESSSTSVGAETLSANVNPRGVATEYHFEYGTGSCAVHAACVSSPSVQLGPAFGGQAVSLQLPSMSPGAYHFRVLAENADGKSVGLEREFEIAAAASGLPDGRSWEMVSPATKDGAEPEPLTQEGGVIQASENGDAISYVADGPMPAGAGTTPPEGNRDPEYPQILSTRGANGWTSRDIATPNDSGTGVEVGLPPEYELFSQNLALALVQPAAGGTGSGPLAEPPLSPTETQQKTLYLRADEPLSPNEFSPLHPDPSEEAIYTAAENNAPSPASPGYVALVSSLNAPGGAAAEFGGGIHEGVEFVTATPSLQQVVFRSYKDAPGYYEWVGAGQPLKPIDVLPGANSVTTENATIGGAESIDSRHAISDDGRLVFWTTTLGGIHLYVRDTVTNETLQLDTRVGVPPNSEVQAATFETASADGSKVFFTDTQRLTPTARAVEKAPDLYVAELSGGAAPGIPLTAKLTDLTPQSGAAVLSAEGQGGGVLGASEREEGHGFNVYFVANGALAPGATEGHCPQGEPLKIATACNLYLDHFSGSEWQSPEFIAQLSSEDKPDWRSPGEYDDLSGVTSQVSQDGEYLAFMSDRSLTGYDNEDANAQQLRNEDRGYVSRITVEAGEDREKAKALKTEREEATSRGEETLANELGTRELHATEAADFFEEESRELEAPLLDEEVYLYNASANRLVCASCNPSGTRPTGVRDEVHAGEGLGILVSRTKTWEHAGSDKWLAGSVPGWTALSGARAIYQSRYLSNSGRLFFNSADALAEVAVPTRPEAIAETSQQVGVENVYEYEPNRVGACTSEGGCVGLISSGASARESSFLDASANGNDVFFLTAQPLVPQDTDSNLDVYDAHVCEASSPCVAATETTQTQCEVEGGEACQEYTPPPVFGAPGSATEPASSNFLGRVGILGEKQAVKPTPKPLTRAQKLAKALKACRTKYKKQKSKRVGCEKQARKKYGPARKSAKKSNGVPLR
jgi:DNA-binding beta-propeller fold protein YncE